MNRFDIVIGHYFFCMHYHNGQSSKLYERLSHILSYFKPSPLWEDDDIITDPDLQFENAKEVYDALVEKFNKGEIKN